MIIISNKKLREYLEEKDILVTKGRKISIELEGIEVELEKMRTEQRKYTNECNPKELMEKGDALQNKINAEIEELEKIGNEIQQIKLAAIPPEKKKAFEDLKTIKEGKEIERNKIALKVQKIKDRAIPIIQKEVRPLLKDEYDDIETANIKGGKIVVDTFNHLQDWKNKFRQQNKNSQRKPENLKK